MASLMENLIHVLTQECEAYEALLKLSQEKTPIIVQGDLEGLAHITDEEQDQTTIIVNLERKRQEVMRDMAIVLNRDVQELKLKNLISMLSARPGEQKALAAVYERLQTVVHRLQQVNRQNGELIGNAMEMVQFEMNLLQAMKTAPETANYSRGGYNAGDTMGVARGGFDAKQ